MKNEYTKFCMHCGVRLGKEAVFCPNCGRKVESKELESENLEDNISEEVTDEVDKVEESIEEIVENDERKPKQKKSKCKKLIIGISIGIGLAVVIVGSITVWNFNNNEVPIGSNSTNVINTQQGITPNFFKSTDTKYYGQNYNVYLYNIYTRVRSSIMDIRYYKPMGQQGMVKTVPSPQLDLNIANWVKSFCTQKWYISSEKKVGNPNVPNTPEDLSNIDFSKLEPQSIRYVNYDQNEDNLYRVPVYKLIQGTKGNNLDMMADGQQVFVFSGIKAAENSGLFNGSNPNHTIIKGNNYIVTTNQKVETNNAYPEKTQYVKTTKYIKDQKDIIVPKSLYEIENNITYNDVETPNGEISIEGDVSPNTTISSENLTKIQDKVINSIIATLEKPENASIFPLANKERFESELTTVIRQNLNLARIDGTKDVKEYGAMGAVNNSNYQYLVPVVSVSFENANDSETYKKYFRLNITGSLAKSYGYNQIYVNVGFSDDRPTN